MKTMLNVIDAAAEGQGGHALSPETDAVLTPAALLWLADLPVAVRPLLTAEKHPHVLNQLCNAWPFPEQLHQCFVELLIDRRGDRQGFSFAVSTELMALQTYCTERLSGEQREFWKEYAGSFNFSLD